MMEGYQPPPQPQEQLKDIKKPHAHDVLSGRGNFVNHHFGNENFRKLVKHHKIAYVACPKARKAIYSKMIYDDIRAMSPPGRFLKQDPKTKLWSDIGEKKALDKTRQALREGAPEMLKDMGGGGGADDSGESSDDCAMPLPQAPIPTKRPRHETNNSPPNYGGQGTGSILSAALQLQAQQQLMQLTNQGPDFTPEFNAQLQLLKLQLQMNAQCTNPNVVNQQHQGGVEGDISGNGNNMRENQSLFDILSAAQTPNNVSSSNMMHPNQVNSLLVPNNLSSTNTMHPNQVNSLLTPNNVVNNNTMHPNQVNSLLIPNNLSSSNTMHPNQVNSLLIPNNVGSINTMHPNQANSLLAAIQNNPTSASGLFDQLQLQLQLQQQQQQRFAMLNAAMNFGGGMNANKSYHPVRSYTTGHLSRENDQSQLQQQPNRQTQVLIDTPTLSTTENGGMAASAVHRPGMMIDSGPNKPVVVRTNTQRKQRPDREQNNSLSSSNTSMRSSLMSVGGLSLDDMDGTAMSDVFENQDEK